jgi:hypothetical protein
MKLQFCNINSNIFFLFHISCCNLMHKILFNNFEDYVKLLYPGILKRNYEGLASVVYLII